MDRIIFHIDVNSAYLSWSAIDLLQANPDSVDIRTIPAIIGGNQDPPWDRSGKVSVSEKYLPYPYCGAGGKCSEKMSDAHHHSS